MISPERLDELLTAFASLRIALVGDLFLDRYLEVEPIEELSIETGLEAYQVSRVRNSPGALGTVMNNLAALGVGLIRPITVIGDDGHAYDLLKEVRKLPVDDDYIIQDAGRLTPTYTKPMKPDASGESRELNRLDVKTRGPLSAETTRRLCERLRQAFDDSDGLIVLDQFVEENWGVVNEQVRATLADLAATNPDKLIYIDSRAHLGRFTSGILKGNGSELLAAANVAGDGTSAAHTLAQQTGRPVCCTQGEAGITFVTPSGETHASPGIPVTGPTDIVGAGDSATSGIVSALLCGATLAEAADVGNLVASITVQQLGTTGTATPSQVRERRASLGGAGL